MIKITLPNNSKRDPAVISNYVHTQLKKLLSRSVQQFVLVATEALAEHRRSGTTSSNGRPVPLVDTGMTMSVLLPLASHRESGGSIGLGSTIQSYIIQYTNEAIQAFPYKSYNEGGKPAAYHKRGQNRTRKRQDGKNAGRSVYEINYGTPTNTQVSFTFNVGEAAQVVPQINLHSELRQAFTKGAVALEKYFNENITEYIRNKDLIAYLQSGKQP